jgi:hypothetical protein
MPGSVGCRPRLGLSPTERSKCSGCLRGCEREIGCSTPPVCVSPRGTRLEEEEEHETHGQAYSGHPGANGPMGRPYWRAQLGRRPPPSTFDTRRHLPRAGGACTGCHARLRLHSAQQPDTACRGIRRRELTALSFFFFFTRLCVHTPTGTISIYTPPACRKTFPRCGERALTSRWPPTSAFERTAAGESVAARTPVERN